MGKQFEEFVAMTNFEIAKLFIKTLLLSVEYFSMTLHNAWYTNKSIKYNKEIGLAKLFFFGI